MGRGVRARRREGVGQRRAQAWRARGGPATGGLGGRARAVERTQNMPLMLVTLEVSKLSGWLKAHAYCRGRKQGV